MTITRFKKLALAVTGTFSLTALLLMPAPAQMAADDQADAATTFKAKCAVCHGPKAEKKFNATLSDEQMVEAILKGKKVEKPPHMPAYGEKGITADQAKGLVTYMKSLTQ